MQVLGITGTLGAGKGTIVEYLIRNFGFRHYSVRALLTEFILEKGLQVNRDSMVLVANELRRAHGPSFLVETLYERALQAGQHCVIESIRTPGEVYALRQKGAFVLLAIDADPALRYKRIQARNSETDQISFETFLENEAREMTSTDPHHQNLRACIELADYLLNNDEDIPALYVQVEEVVSRLLLQKDTLLKMP